MAEKFLDIILRAKNQAGATFAQFGEQVNRLNRQAGTGSVFGTFGKLAIGGGAVAGFTFAVNKLTEGVAQASKWRDQFERGEISTAEIVENLIVSAPVLGSVYTLARDIRYEFDGTAHAVREAQRAQEQLTQETAEAEKRATAMRAATEAIAEATRKDWRAAYILAISDEGERRRQQIRDEAAESNRAANELFRAKLISGQQLRERTVASERLMLAKIGEIDRAEAEHRGKERAEIDRRWADDWATYIRERMIEAAQGQLDALAQRIAGARGAAGAGLPGATVIGARFSGLAGAYESASAVEAQREAARMQAEQTKLLRDLKDLMRRAVEAPPIFIGV